MLRPLCLIECFITGARVKQRPRVSSHVDNICIVLHATRADPGMSNDETLLLDDEYHNALKTNTLYSDYKYDIVF